MMTFASLSILILICMAWVRGLDAAICGRWRLAAGLLALGAVAAVVHSLVFP